MTLDFMTFREYSRLNGLDIDSLSSLEYGMIPSRYFTLEKEYVKMFDEYASMSFMKITGYVVNAFIAPRIRASIMNGMDDIQKNQFLHARQIISRSVYDGLMDFYDISGKLLDFGCGAGGSALYLDALGGYVEGVENNIDDYMDALNLPLSERSSLIFDDGLKVMKESPLKYDLITAFMFGALDCDLEMVFDFKQACDIALKQDGKAVISSDLLTMDKIKRVFRSEEGFHVSPYNVVYGR